MYIIMLEYFNVWVKDKQILEMSFMCEMVHGNYLLKHVKPLKKSVKILMKPLDSTT